MLILHNISYKHPDKEILFSNINLSLNTNKKLALIGNNGAGKSTLLKIIAKEITTFDGSLHIEEEPYYVPQIFGQFNHLTVAQALHIDVKLDSLKAIINGDVTEHNLNLLNNDWGIEERSIAALQHWQLSEIDFNQTLGTLSGGQKTKVFLAGILIHQPKLILLDEPSNHLDEDARNLLYELVLNRNSTYVVVSHDRQLLNIMNNIAELNADGLVLYDGNYDHYAAKKQELQNALEHRIHDQEKALRKAKVLKQESIERQQKLNARGRQKQEKAGVARIMMNTLKNKAENSSARLKDVHENKIEGISNQLNRLRNTLPDIELMKLGFDDSKLHKGKILIDAVDVNINYNNRFLWKQHLSLRVLSGDRLLIKGSNGSGKTSLIKMALGEITPSAGTIKRKFSNSIYIDQDYSLIDTGRSVYEQANAFNNCLLHDYEVKTRLNCFLFDSSHWDKACSKLSGGEKMRLMLCCLTIADSYPELIVMDEPTNNLDLQNIEILTKAISGYKGTLMIVSHDNHFINEVGVNKILRLQ